MELHNNTLCIRLSVSHLTTAHNISFVAYELDLVNVKLILLDNHCIKGSGSGGNSGTHSQVVL